MPVYRIQTTETAHIERVYFIDAPSEAEAGTRALTGEESPSDSDMREQRDERIVGSREARTQRTLQPATETVRYF